MRLAKRAVNPSPEKARTLGRLAMAAATTYYPPLGLLQEAVQAAPRGNKMIVASLVLAGWLLSKRKGK